MDYLLLIIGILVGIALGFLLAKIRGVSAQSAAEQKLLDAALELQTLQTRYDELTIRSRSLENELIHARTEKEEKIDHLARTESTISFLNEKIEAGRKEQEALAQKFTVEFENLANRIFESKNQTFKEQNKNELNLLLDPFRINIKEFEKKVEETYVQGTRERSAIKEQIEQMMRLNEQMSNETKNLTKALKGESKTQGNWGEVILERILETSGLTRGREYQVQESITGEDGSRLQPDVVIYLPEDKRIVIDAKVSLLDYERFVSEEDETKRMVHLRQHINSIKNHVKGLSAKNYQSIYEIAELDFVLMFIPIEPAFSIALQHDHNLFKESFEKNVILVSNTTLLATLRTISSIWRHEYQNRNALDIAARGGALYDKFVAFTEDLINLGKKLDSSKDEYENAMRKLYSGKGNLVGQTEKLRDLGAKASKKIDQRLLEKSDISASDE
jgi:DNA recombination protein RmuC